MSEALRIWLAFAWPSASTTACCAWIFFCSRIWVLRLHLLLGNLLGLDRPLELSRKMDVGDLHGHDRDAILADRLVQPIPGGVPDGIAVLEDVVDRIGRHDRLDEVVEGGIEQLIREISPTFRYRSAARRGSMEKFTLPVSFTCCNSWLAASICWKL